jgi:hypothetical protein
VDFIYGIYVPSPKDGQRHHKLLAAHVHHRSAGVVSQSPAGVAVLSDNKVSPTGCGCRQQALKQGLLQLGGGLHQCKEWCGLGSSTPESTTTA